MLVWILLFGCARTPEIGLVGDSGVIGGDEASGDDGGDDGGDAGGDDGSTGDEGGDAGGDDGSTGDDTGEVPLPALFVNEIMAANEGSYEGPDGSEPDWIELYNAGDSPLDLTGLTISDDYDNKGLHVFPEGLVIGPGDHLLLLASGAEEPGPTELPFRLSASGEGVGVFMPDGAPIDWVLYSSQRGDVAAARIPDGGEEWVQMPVGTPGAENRVLDWQELDLLSAGATWSYEDSGTDLGAAWRELDYDDSAWSEGAAPLGYGDSHVVTTVAYGESSAAKNPTTYFRLVLSLDEVPSEVTAEVLQDDGSILWINGVEALRSNLPTGDVAYDTYASSAISGANETAYDEQDLDPGLFVAGENVIAVELHQATASSSDLGFDLALSARVLTEAR